MIQRSWVQKYKERIRRDEFIDKLNEINFPFMSVDFAASLSEMKGDTDHLCDKMNRTLSQIADSDIDWRLDKLTFYMLSRIAFKSTNMTRSDEIFRENQQQSAKVEIETYINSKRRKLKADWVLIVSSSSKDVLRQKSKLRLEALSSTS